MLVSANILKWALRIYPPLLFQRIWVLNVTKDFRLATVKINKSLLTRNYNHSIFGGTLFSAADPIYPALLHQLLTTRGFDVRVWLRSATIRYIEPALYDLIFAVEINDDLLENAEQNLTTIGRHKQQYEIEIVDTVGRLCAIVRGEIYIRNLAVEGRVSELNDESNHE
jgi:acyl-coenzyme A thioesterase PaaI-like protein